VSARGQIRAGERGHLMAGVMVLVAILLISSTVVFQAWNEVLRRDNEAEMIFRAQEIVRAIVRFRVDRGTTPEKLEDLLGPGQRGQYFIRQLYADPLVPDGRWGVLYAGPGGEIIDPNGENYTEGAEGIGILKEAPTGATQFEERRRAAELRRAARGKRRGVDPRRFGEGGSLEGRAGEFVSEAAGGRQLAGLRLAGVKSLCEDRPFRVYKNQMQYSQWLFSYLDLDQVRLPGQGGQPGQPGLPGQLGQPGREGGRGGRRGLGPGAGDRMAPGGAGAVEPPGAGRGGGGRR
jgi:hypothetical protein